MFKKTLPLIVTFVVGTLMVLEFFVPHYQFRSITDRLLEWGTVLASSAYLLGLVNILRVNVPKVVRGEKDWGYRLILLLGLVTMLGAGLYGGPGRLDDGQVYKWMYDYTIVPLGSTMFALLAFFVASAAFRAFRARNVEATILLVAAAFVMIGAIPVGEALPLIGDYMPRITNWLMGVPNVAARRAIFIGSALGAIATGLRIILGIERSHLGSD